MKSVLSLNIFKLYKNSRIALPGFDSLIESNPKAYKLNNFSA